MAAIQSYLENYAEPGSNKLARLLSHAINSVLVVPAFDELAEALAALVRHPDPAPRATILVLNAPASAERDALERTRNTRDQLCELFGLRAATNAGGIRCLHAQLSSNQSVFVLDLSGEGNLIDPKLGVGRARKIGLDLALAMSEQSAQKFGQHVEWLHSTDADARLPNDYFALPDYPNSGSANEVVTALVYPYAHIAEPGLEKAMALYQFRLDYYTAALSEAGSPYAYHSIGSTLAVRPKAYAQARGMPQRAAGEDFYLLNKVAKLGRVVMPPVSAIVLAGRDSQRVPFGTGPALVDITALKDPYRDYLYYPPQAFKALRALLQGVPRWSLPEDINEQSIEAVFFETLEHEAGANMSKHIQAALTNLGINRFVTHLAKQRPKDIERAFHDWFDAFRTLKFIHYLRDHHYPSANLESLWQQGDHLPAALVPELQRLIALLAPRGHYETA